MARKTYATEIIVALIGAGATVGAALIGLHHGKDQGLEEARHRVTLQVNVFNASSSSGVPDAFVRLSGNEITEARQTDSTGQVTFELSLDRANRLATIQVEASSFQNKSEEVRLVSGYTRHDIRLQPTQSAAAAPLTSPNKVQRVFSSGPRLSGTGANFSDWYTLCSEGIPRAGQITNVSFALSGDRRCGSWANCKESERSANRVCYQFQMQGHNEWLSPGQAASEGILTVEFLDKTG